MQPPPWVNPSSALRGRRAGPSRGTGGIGRAPLRERGTHVCPSTDVRWARIEPLLPDRTPRRGGRWRDHREVIDVIAFEFQTGTQWVHLPEKYGNWRGVCNRCGSGPSTALGSECSPR
ncbi:transposase [Streptomyces sp. NPDC001292]|uniref:transposase n=1 Tax=Streptomyces sp. NPDC001292 TaxID=3364558 RepID=UPI0036B6AC3A